MVCVVMAYALLSGLRAFCAAPLERWVRTQESISTIDSLTPNRCAQELNLPGLKSWSLTRHPYLVFYVELPDQIVVWQVLDVQRG